MGYTSRIKSLIIIILVVILLFIIAAYVILWAPNTFEEDKIIIVSKGESFTQVVDSLEKAGVIRNRTLFVIAGRILNLTTKMQIGKYRFKSGISNKEILEDLQYGKSVELIRVTIPEGLMAKRQAKIFARELGIDSAIFISLVNNPAFAESISISTNSLEGFLMPKTYMFYWQTDEREIIDRMVSEFWESFDSTMRSRLMVLKLDLNEILTLASIIEAETAVDSERTIIAGVYYNRLQKRMRLEADPTIQYIIKGGPRRLKYSDLKIESDYNTYINYGLPPGPVNNPGHASIIAALYPAKHKYLYFVANGTGGHTFTKTYSEHLRAVKTYRNKRDVKG